MRVHYIQHVAFEGLGSIEPYLTAKGYQISVTRLYQDEPLPKMEQFDWLIVMGGPMGIEDEQQFPWIKKEKVFIKAAIDTGKTLLGICLGAQLIADVLGAKVVKNKAKEIGWFPLHINEKMKRSSLGDFIADGLDVFHWHGDTFEIPNGALRVASSEACDNQGFVYNNCVVGFQFHLETTAESAALLIEHGESDLDGSRYVQTKSRMLENRNKFNDINKVMKTVLDRLEARTLIS